MKRIIYLVVAAGIFGACQPGKEAGNDTDPTSIAVDSVSFKKASQPRITEGGDTLVSYIDVVYPKLSGGNEQAITEINAFMANLPLRGLAEIANSGTGFKNIEEAANGFFASVSAAQKEMPDAPNMVYTYEALGDTMLISASVISLFYNESTYTGGAHGNYSTHFFNFDATTGRLLKLEEIVKDTLALNKMAEIKFREEETQSAKENNMEFKMEDYFFPENKFILPQNIGITKEGLRFLYNPYEVAPYARGVISFDIPWKDLNGMVVEKYAAGK